MILGSFYFKGKAKAALKGNWQTALLIAFFSSVFLTATDLVRSVAFPDVLAYAERGAAEEFYQALFAIPRGTYLLFFALCLFSFALSPMLTLGCRHYFVCRLKGEELGFRGLFSRARLFGRALWLYVQLAVRIFLWSLLLVVPGVLAALRYSMAPYFLAENPEISAGEAIERSKRAMQNQKMSYFLLKLSFYGWLLLSLAAQTLLMSISVIFALVAAQFMQLAISAYMEASCASFFLAVESEEGLRAARGEMRDRLREMGMTETPYDEPRAGAHGGGDGAEEDEEDAEDAVSRGDDDGAEDAVPQSSSDCANGSSGAHSIMTKRAEDATPQSDDDDAENATPRGSNGGAEDDDSAQDAVPQGSSADTNGNGDTSNAAPDGGDHA